MEQEQPILAELHYFPSILYFAMMLEASTLVIEQQEHYVKRSYRNRAHLAAANGALRLSVPLVKGKNQQQPIREVQISYAENWQGRHWQSIQSAYGKSPFFEFYKEDLAPFFEKQYEFLFDLNLDILKVLLQLLQIEVKLTFSASFLTESDASVLDLRNQITPQKLPDQSIFPYQLVSYPQVFVEKSGFLKNLSILDLLFCMGPEAVSYLGRIQKG